MNIFAKISSYLSEALKEIKKVSWPTKKETRQYTWLVIGISIATAIYLGGLDYLFNWLLEITLS